MAPPSVAGALVGGAISGALPANVLLAVIGVTLLYFGFDLLRPKHAASAGCAGRELDIRAAVISGALIGVLGGLVGLILGALRMPALLRYVGETPARAVGTNMTVGFCVGCRRPRRSPRLRGRLDGVLDRRGRVGSRRAARRADDGSARAALSSMRAIAVVLLDRRSVRCSSRRLV